MDWAHQLRLRRLEMLLSLAQTRNISRSAAALNTTQPALSKWLKEMETDVGLPLFARHARGLTPTAYGEALISHARRIQAHLDAARDDLAAMRDGGAGRIVLGTAGASIGSAAPAAIIRLMALYPNATVELVEGTMDRLLEQLTLGNIDIVVGRETPAPAGVGLLSETLYVEPIHFIVRPGHPLLALPALEWADILAYRWIIWPRGTAIREALDKALDAIGIAPPPLSIQSGALTLNLSLMNSSDMIALASHRETARFSEWNIATTLPLSLPVFGEVAVYWRDDGDNRPMLAAMLRCLREAAGQTA